MKSTATNSTKAFILITLGLAIAAMGGYVAEADDAPGAAAIGGLLMIGAVVVAVRTARNQLPRWVAPTAIGVGVVVTVLAALLTHGVVVTGPLHAQSQDVPSVVGAAPSPQYTAAVERARTLVRAAVLEQNLPGVSVAVGASVPAEASANTSGAVIWTEGFGWRDVGTKTAVTPNTRFNIGTAASLVAPHVASLGLANTGTEAAKAWSPEAIGEEGEDFPPFALARHLILQPIGLMASDYPLPGERATFYVPRYADNSPGRRGRRLMYMRDLACCADGMAFYSTPTDLVRVALATNADRVNGELAGGAVMSLVIDRANGIVVAVTSNIAFANTPSLASGIAEAFRRP